jgi:EpsI family protein
MRSVARWLGSLTKGLFLPVSLILALQATASRRLSIQERDIPIPALHQLPLEAGKWKAGAEQTLERNVAEYLKPDDYIIRDYVNEGSGNSINLFVAHFKSLQDSYGPHSPRVCLPGAGWLVASSKIETLPVAGRAEPLSVNEYVLEKSGARILVIYWYQNDRDAWAEEFHAKLRLLPDLIRYRRSDVSLVRVIMPLRGAIESERASCLEFTRLLFPLLAERFGAPGKRS